MSIALAKALVDTLPQGMPGLFNPWLDRCRFDSSTNGPEQRLERLSKHLECDARLILVGEAPGYQGCRYSGMGFTSERLLLEGEIPRVAKPEGRLSTRDLPFSEPSATIVWKHLRRIGMHEKTILWNALQMHPFKGDSPWTNRTPTDAELAHGRAAVLLLREAFPNALLVAVGRKAELVLRESRIIPDAAVRHPANGGATKFGMGMDSLIKCGLPNE